MSGHERNHDILTQALLRDLQQRLGSPQKRHQITLALGLALLLATLLVFGVRLLTR